MTVPITPDQLAKLQAKIDVLKTDLGTANQATAGGNDAHAALQKAQADVAAKDAAEAAADGVVNVDIADLQAFVAGLGTVPPPPGQ